MRFLSSSSVEEGLYDVVKEGDRVSIDLGFALRGLLHIQLMHTMD